MSFEVRCAKCENFLQMAEDPVRLWKLFKASTPIQVPPADVAEIRRRCRRCGYVNVFVPRFPLAERNRVA